MIVDALGVSDGLQHQKRLNCGVTATVTVTVTVTATAGTGRRHGVNRATGPRGGGSLQFHNGRETRGEGSVIDRKGIIARKRKTERTSFAEK